jgi:quercetin dioxygenase-like cupin family protein
MHMAQGQYLPAGTVEQVEMLAGVLRRTLGTTEGCMLIEVSLAEGSVVPMHSHPNEQVGYVVGGQIEMTVDGVVRVCGPGDSYAIPGGVEHMARAVSDCVVIDCFTPPREDYR